jgi:hypothetical protein
MILKKIIKKKIKVKDLNKSKKKKKQLLFCLNKKFKKV